VQTALMDREFEAVRSACPTLPINTTAANEHVPEIERAVRTVKDRARGIYNTLPFTEGIPKLMTIELIHFVVLWLNAFPVKSGISTKFSPRELVQRHKLSAKIHCKTLFGTYCEVHDEPQPSNSMQPRTHETICMGPTGNAQGSYKFYYLKTKQKLTRRQWSELPMPKSIIRKVHRHARVDKMQKGLRFSNRNNSPYEFDNEEYDEAPERLVEEEPAPYPDILEELPGVETLENHEGITPAVMPEQHDGERAAVEAARNANIAPGEDGLDQGPVIIEQDEESMGDDEEPELIEHVRNDQEAVSVADESLDGGAGEDFETTDEPEVKASDVDPEDSPEDDLGGGSAEGSDEEEHGELRRSSRHRTKSTRLTWDTRHQGNVFAQYMQEDAEDDVDDYMHSMVSEENCAAIDSYLVPVFEFIITQYSFKSGLKKVRAGKDREMVREMLTQYCMTQYSLKAGLKKFGKEGEAAVSKELGQFHDLSVFIPMDASELTREQREAALASLMFLKEKKDGTVKARACADGRKQLEKLPRRTQLHQR